MLIEAYDYEALASSLREEIDYAEWLLEKGDLDKALSTLRDTMRSYDELERDWNHG